MLSFVLVFHLGLNFIPFSPWSNTFFTVHSDFLFVRVSLCFLCNCSWRLSGASPRERRISLMDIWNRLGRGFRRIDVVFNGPVKNLTSIWFQISSDLISGGLRPLCSSICGWSGKHMNLVLGLRDGLRYNNGGAKEDRSRRRGSFHVGETYRRLKLPLSPWRTCSVSRSFFFGRVEDDVAITSSDFGFILMFYLGLFCNILILGCNVH